MVQGVNCSQFFVNLFNGTYENGLVTIDITMTCDLLFSCIMSVSVRYINNKNPFWALGGKEYGPWY